MAAATDGGRAVRYLRGMAPVRSPIRSPIRSPVPCSLAALATLTACGGAGAGASDAAPDDGGADASAAYGDPLVGIGAVSLVRGGYQFVEGPQWRDAEGDLLFSDIPASTIYRYAPGGAAPTVFRMPSNNSNGLALDPAGAVLAAEHGTRAVSRAGVAIATMFEGKRLNSPNDVIAAADGTIYFSDPPYGIPAGQQQELAFNGVFRLTPAGQMFADYRTAPTSRPNGVGLSPDGKTLYVDDTADGKLYQVPVGDAGALGARGVLATTSGNPDGLAIDLGGNVFVATATGVEVFSPAGARWGVIAVPEQPANCAFGDADHQSLYITARTGLYRVRLAHPGLPRR